MRSIHKLNAIYPHKHQLSEVYFTKKMSCIPWHPMASYGHNCDHGSTLVFATFTISAGRPVVRWFFDGGYTAAGRWWSGRMLEISHGEVDGGFGKFYGKFYGKYTGYPYMHIIGEF